MSPRAIPLLSVALLIACAPRGEPSHGAPEPQEAAPLFPPAFDATAIDVWMAQEVEQRRITGAALAVVHDGAVVVESGYGRRSLGADAPVTPETVFRGGSFAKLAVAVAVLMLQEEGRLSLADPVARWYPDLDRSADVQLLHLLGHTSGYVDYYPHDFLDERAVHPIPVDTLIARQAALGLAFEPGTRFSYSNTGYQILGRIVERTSGQSLDRFFRERIGVPAGMTRSGFAHDPAWTDVAEGTTAAFADVLEPAQPEADGWTFAAGGIYTTAGDLARLLIALMDGRLLSEPSWRILTTPQLLADGRSTEYGGGLVLTQRAGELVAWHDGSVNGFSSEFLMMPRTRSAVVLLASVGMCPVWELAEPLAGLLQEPPMAAPPVVGPGPAEIVRELVLAIQAGHVDRTRLAPDFAAFLSTQRLQQGRAALEPLGRPTDIVVEASWERTGRAVHLVQVHFATRTLKAVLQQTPDGVVQELVFLWTP